MTVVAFAALYLGIRPLLESVCYLAFWEEVTLTVLAGLAVSLVAWYGIGQIVSLMKFRGFLKAMQKSEMDNFQQDDLLTMPSHKLPPE